MDRPISSITPSEVPEQISLPQSKKCPGWDGIYAKAMESLLEAGILFLVLLFKSILRLDYFPIQWKYAEIMMIHKAGKSEN